SHLVFGAGSGIPPLVGRTRAGAGAVRAPGSGSPGGRVRQPLGTVRGDRTSRGSAPGAGRAGTARADRSGLRLVDRSAPGPAGPNRAVEGCPAFTVPSALPGRRVAGGSAAAGGGSP